MSKNPEQQEALLAKRERQRVEGAMAMREYLAAQDATRRQDQAPARWRLAREAATERQEADERLTRSIPGSRFAMAKQGIVTTAQDTIVDTAKTGATGVRSLAGSVADARPRKCRNRHGAQSGEGRAPSGARQARQAQGEARQDHGAAQGQIGQPPCGKDGEEIAAPDGGAPEEIASVHSQARIQSDLLKA